MQTTMIPLGKIQPSPTNPRQRFNQDEIRELAKSIASVGVLQAVVVRPWPEGREQPSTGAEYDETADYELVAGERRWRAACLAGLEAIPATVRDLTDRQVLEIQVIENEARADVLPSERAAGYAALIEAGTTVDELAQRVGKSASTIRAILLLNRLPDAARNALDDGTIPRTVAELIARLPRPEQREQAARDILAGEHWNRDERDGPVPLTFRKAKDYIESQHQVELKGCPFSQSDKKLLPDVGSCKDCPKRWGNLQKADPVNYAGGRADVCTDPQCYERKCERHKANVLKKSQRDGYQIWPGDFPHHIGVPTGYVCLHGLCEPFGEKGKKEGMTWIKALHNIPGFKERPTVDLYAALRPNGEPVHFVREKEAWAALVAAGFLPSGLKGKQPSPVEAVKGTKPLAIATPVQTPAPSPSEPRKPQDWEISRKAVTIGAAVLYEMVAENGDGLHGLSDLGGSETNAIWEALKLLSLAKVEQALDLDTHSADSWCTRLADGVLTNVDYWGRDDDSRGMMPAWRSFIDRAQPEQLIALLMKMTAMECLHPKEDLPLSRQALLNWGELDWDQLKEQAERELTTGKKVEIPEGVTP